MVAQPGKLASMIFCLFNLHVSFRDIGRSLLWQHEKVHADDGSSFF